MSFTRFAALMALPWLVAIGVEYLVLRRFYRADPSRQARGVGLGLSLVAAILKLHGFRLGITPGPGLVVEIACPRAK